MVQLVPAKQTVPEAGLLWDPLALGDLRAAASPTYDENDNDEDYSEAAAYLAVEELTQPLVGDGGDEELTQLEAGDVGDVGDQVGD